MLKRIRKAYDNRAGVASYSVVLMSLAYPILNGWLYKTFGLSCTAIIVSIYMLLLALHGFILATKLFPRISEYFGSLENGL